MVREIVRHPLTGDAGSGRIKASQGKGQAVGIKAQGKIRTGGGAVDPGRGFRILGEPRTGRAAKTPRSIEARPALAKSHLEFD